MTERPIIFSTEMVRAILDGRKTQTRRIIKPQAHHYNPDLLQPFILYPCKEGEPFGDVFISIKSPYGYPWKKWNPDRDNDRLWVREGFGYSKKNNYFLWRSENSYEIGNWKSPYHLRRYQARIFLEVVDLKIDRLNNISENDAIKEGTSLEVNNYKVYKDYKSAFIRLWCRVHKSEDAWVKNPWVWVIEFKKTNG